MTQVRRRMGLSMQLIGSLDLLESDLQRDVFSVRFDATPAWPTGLMGLIIPSSSPTPPAVPSGQQHRAFQVGSSPLLQKVCSCSGSQGVCTDSCTWGLPDLYPGPLSTMDTSQPVGLAESYTLINRGVCTAAGLAAKLNFVLGILQY